MSHIGKLTLWSFVFSRTQVLEMYKNTEDTKRLDPGQEEGSGSDSDEN
jgi:hypothetical protein